MAAITRLAVGGLDTPDGRALIAAVVDETVAAAAASRVEVDRARIMTKIAFALANHRGHQPSMLQDVLAGRATEIASINGAIVDAAAAAGLAAPVNRTLVHLVQLIEQAPAALYHLA